MLSAATLERTLSDYADLTSDEQWRRIESLSSELDGVRVLHVNSTATGGGVAELLRSVVPLFDDLGVDTDWLVMEADDPFFEVTKAFHNSLQGGSVGITDEMRSTYRTVTERNAAAIDEEYDVVVLHDPQTLGMIETLADAFPDTRFVWRCHIDLTDAAGPTLSFLVDDVRQVDHVVFTRPEYGEPLEAAAVPSSTIHPSIDPLAEKNRPLDPAESATERERLHGIPLDGDAPVLTQVSRFDPWKDQLGLVEAYRRLRERFPDVQLVLAGGMAADDPEGREIFDRVAAETADEPGVHLLTNEPDATINLLQRRSDVVVQKSLREGFGLVVAEALWKRTPVVGSNVGGIPLQIEDGRNGYLVEPDDVDAVVDRTDALLADEPHRERLGRRGRETVREEFLLPRQLVDYGELFLDVL